MLTLGALALLLTVPRAARADEPAAAATTWLVTVDVSDKASGALSLTVALADRACAEAESAAGDLVVKLEVCHVGPPGASSFAFRVERHEQRGKSSVRQRTTAQARLAPGKSAMIGRLVQGGSETRVSATLGAP